MTPENFDAIVADQLHFCVQVLTEKSLEYAPGSDRLIHFRETAVEQDAPAKAALWGMLSKHLTSLKLMCQSGDYPKDRWLEKITDSINYLLLLRGLVEEDISHEDNA